MMEVAAKLRNADMSAQKARLVADMVRGMAVGPAIDRLKFTEKKAAHVVRKLLESAIANAEHNNGADIDGLKIHRIFVDEAQTLKRFQARAKGRGNRILKRRCHITIVVSETANQERV